MANKLKHLGFIQGTINRLANNSFLIKGWSIGLVTAIFVFLGQSYSPASMIIVYFPVISFWFLDAYFLWQERLYRVLYDEVRKIKENDINFSMKIQTFSSGKNTYHETFTSCTLSCFYIPLIIVMSIIILLK